jgi:hypothetical protein
VAILSLETFFYYFVHIPSLKTKANELTYLNGLLLFIAHGIEKVEYRKAKIEQQIQK